MNDSTQNKTQTEIMRGDAYPLEIALQDEDGIVLTDEDVTDLEVVLGPLRRAYPGDISYDETAQAFILQLSQADTFALEAGAVRLQLRPRFADGAVCGRTICEPIIVRPADSQSQVIGA